MRAVLSILFAGAVAGCSSSSSPPAAQAAAPDGAALRRSGPDGCRRRGCCRFLPGGGLARREHRGRSAPGSRGRLRLRVPRDPLRGAARRRPALEGAAAADAVDGGPRRIAVRQPVPAERELHEHDAREHHRGLPVSQRLDPQPVGLEAARDGLDPRGRELRGLGVGLPSGRGGRPERRRRRLLLRRRIPLCERGGGRLAQLPPRHLRLLPPPGPRRGGVQGGQPGALGPALRDAVGPGQHREVRRRPAERDDLRRVGRCVQRLLARRLGAEAAALRARHQRERGLHDPPADPRRGAAARARGGRGGRMRRSGDRQRRRGSPEGGAAAEASTGDASAADSLACLRGLTTGGPARDPRGGHLLGAGRDLLRGRRRRLSEPTSRARSSRTAARPRSRTCSAATTTRPCSSS